MKQKIKYILGVLVTAYFLIRHIWPVWFYILNRRARRLYRNHSSGLDLVQKRIIRDLKEKGVAVTHLDELFPGERLLPVFQDYVARFEEQAKSKGSKPFLKYFWKPVPEVGFSNPFFRFALHARVIDIVNGYIGMFCQFYFLVLNRTLPVGKDILPTKSQRWHRDFEDKKMCKMFLYLSDVDQGAGPFIYTEESHYGQRFGGAFPQQPPLGSYPPTEEVEKRIPCEAMKMYTGPAGTLIFCDTSGLHRGGYATTKDRVMFTAGYRTPASPSETRYRLSEGALESADSKKLRPAARAALVVRPHSFAFKLFKRFVEVPEYY